MLTTERLTPEQQAALQKEKLLLLGRAVVAPALERHAAVKRLRDVHKLSDQQIYSQIGAASSVCRLEENQAILLRLSTAVTKLTLAPVVPAPVAQVPVALDAEAVALLTQLMEAVQKLSAPAPQIVQPPVPVDAEAEAFRKSWLFRVWRFLAA